MLTRVELPEFTRSDQLVAEGRDFGAVEATIALRAGLALDPSTFHRPVPIVLTPADAADLRALGYGGEVEEK